MPKYNKLPKSIEVPQTDYAPLNNLKVVDDKSANIILMKVYNYYQNNINDVQSELELVENKDGVDVLQDVISTFKNNVTLLSQIFNNIDDRIVKEALKNELTILSTDITLTQKEIAKGTDKIQKLQNRIDELTPEHVETL